MKKVIVFFCMMIFCFVEKGYAFDQEKVSKLKDNYIQTIGIKGLEIDKIEELARIKKSKKYGHRKYRTKDSIVEYNITENNDKTISGVYSEYYLKEKLYLQAEVSHDLISKVHIWGEEDKVRVDLYLYPKGKDEVKMRMIMVPLDKKLDITSDMKLVSNTQQTQDNSTITINEYSNGKRSLVEIKIVDYNKNEKMTIVGDPNDDDKFKFDLEGTAKQ